jgi:hypothetical protein
VERVLVEGSVGTGVGAYHGGSRLELESVVIRDVSTVAEGWGIGIIANSGGLVTGSRVSIDRSTQEGIISIATGSVVVSDVLVRDTRPERAGLLGDGARAQEGGVLELERVAALRNHFGGISANNAGSSVVLRHVLAAGTLERPSGGFGAGLMVLMDASVIASAARLERNGTAGAMVLLGQLTLEDATVTDTLGDRRGRHGNGLILQGSAVVRRARFERNREVAVTTGAYGDAMLEDVIIGGTLERGCAGTTCADEGAGTGLGAYDLGRVTVRGFSIEGSPLCGVQIASGAIVDLTGGRVVDNAIGACVQQPAYAIDRLTREVIFDNAVNIDAETAHPIPEPIVLD